MVALASIQLPTHPPPLRLTPIGSFCDITGTETSIDVLPSKNQALCDYCTFVSKLNTVANLPGPVAY